MNYYREWYGSVWRTLTHINITTHTINLWCNVLFVSLHFLRLPQINCSSACLFFSVSMFQLVGKSQMSTSSVFLSKHSYHSSSSSEDWFSFQSSSFAFTSILFHRFHIRQLIFVNYVQYLWCLGMKCLFWYLICVSFFSLASTCSVCVCDTGVSPVSSEIFIICGRDDWKVYVQSGVVILL